MAKVFQLSGAKEAQQLINRFAQQFPTAVTLGSTRAAEHFRRVLQTQFLSGQSIGRRSGILYRTWNVVAVQKPPGAILGTPVKYAAAHNEGLNKKVSVRAHQRKRALKKKQEGETVRSFKRRKKERDEAGYVVNVKQHSKKINLRKRDFLGKAVAAGSQMAEIIIAKTLSKEIGNF